MNFTFGIITDGNNHNRVGDIIQSIDNLKIPNYEILIVGGSTQWPSGGGVWFLPFDESAKPEGWISKIEPYEAKSKSQGWITKKKNYITGLAQYENIVYVHDYITFHCGWYEGWLQFGNDFDVATNCISTLEGYRHSDWVVDPVKLWKLYPELKEKFWDLSLPYDVNFTPVQFISGNYWVAKRNFMLENPLNENYLWGEAEDLEWSDRIRNKTQFKFNPNSLVTIMKPNKWAPGMLPEKYFNRLRKEYNV